MILTKIKQKLAYYLSLWTRRTGGQGKSLIRETRLIAVLIIVMFVLLTLSLTFGSPRDVLDNLFSRDNRENIPVGIGLGEVNPTLRDIAWEVDIPHDFNLQESDSYETAEFAIFYNRAADNYYVNIYQGEEYTFDEIKAFIETKVLVQISDFNSYNKLPNSLILYYDYRGGYTEEFDLGTFKVNP